MPATISGSSRVQDALRKSTTQLVDHITIGDSNCERSRGWPHGLQWALLQEFGADSCYGSGLFCFNERNSNSSTGYQIGYSAANTGTDIRNYHPVAVNVHPMPDALRSAWDVTLDPNATKNHINPYWRTDADRRIGFTDLDPGFVYNEVITGAISSATGYFRYISGNYLYYKAISGTILDSDPSIDGGTSGASCVPSENAVTITPQLYGINEPAVYIKHSETNIVGSFKTDDMVWNVWHGVFGAGDYDPAAPPAFSWVRAFADAGQRKFWSTTALTSFKDSDHGLTGTQFNPEPMSFDWTGYSGTGSDITIYEVSSTPKYPQALYFHTVINRDKEVGWSVNQLFDTSGSRATQAAGYLEAMGSESLAKWLKCATYRAESLGQTPTSIVWLLHGINDANSSVSKAIYKTATQGIIVAMQAAWVEAGYSLLDLSFVVAPGHVSDPTKEVYLEQYRTAAIELSTQMSNVITPYMPNITDATELAAVGMPRWDTSGTDTSHLAENNSDSDNSYSILMDRIITAIQDADLTSDSSSYVSRPMTTNMVTDPVWEMTSN